MRDNFDMCSYGIGLEFYIFHDTTRGRCDFDDNFLQLEEGTYYYTNWGNICDTPDNLDELYTEDDELKEGIIRFATRGYSQGDYADVYIDTYKLENIFGVCPNLDGIKKDIRKLFWDCPISGHITLHHDGEEEEILVWEMLTDEYIWDKEEVIKSVMEYTRKRLKVKEELFVRLEQDLIQLLPEYPDYN
jgi:hypothetical protein